LKDLQGVAVSADGQSIYTVSGASAAIARLDRDPTSGAMTYVGCITSNSSVTGCTPIPGAVVGGMNTNLNGLLAVAVSADGKSVYTGGGQAIAHFDREASSTPRPSRPAPPRRPCPRGRARRSQAAGSCCELPRSAFCSSRRTTR
jgi:hypothetical protein